MDHNQAGQSNSGVEQPGIKWGPFTARIPFVHTGVTWPELLHYSSQGLIHS